MPRDDKVYRCDRCHAAPGVKGVLYDWLCAGCAEEYIAQIERERWSRYEEY